MGAGGHSGHIGAALSVRRWHERLTEFARFPAFLALVFAAVGLSGGGVSAQISSTFSCNDTLDGDCDAGSGSAPPVTFSITETASSTGDLFTLSGSGGGKTISGSFTEGGATVPNAFERFRGTVTISGKTVPIDCTVLLNGTTTGSCAGLDSIFGSLAAGLSAQSAQQVIANAATGASQAVTRTQVQNSVTLIMGRIQSISRDIALSLRSGQQSQVEDRPRFYNGLSAGSPDKKWGYWLDGSGSYLSNDGSVSTFEGYGVSGLGGVDYNYQNSWLFGFSAGYVRTDLSVNQLHGHRIANGAQLGPYVSYIVSSNVTIDTLFNYTRLSNSASGLSSFDSNRYTTAINLNIFTEPYGISLTSYGGFAYAWENPESGAPSTVAGTSTTTHYGAFRFGLEAAYPMGNWEPYVPVRLEINTTKNKDQSGQFGITFGVGARYKIDDSVKAGIVVTTEQARSHSQDVIAEANLRVIF
jgi:hypothetical protein